MDRREILAERPVEKGRGFMPGVTVNPSRVLFTAGLTGRDAAGNLVTGGMAPQVHRTFERLQAIVGHAGAGFDAVVKQLVYVTDIDAFMTTGDIRRRFFVEPYPVTTTVQVVRLYHPDLLVEITAAAEIPRDRFRRPAAGSA